MAGPTTNPFDEYFGVLRRRRWLVLVPLLLSTLTAVVLVALQPPVYSSTTDIVIQSRTGEAIFAQSAAVDDRVLRTEVLRIEGSALRSRVRNDLGLDEDPPKVKAVLLDSTDAISVTARESSAAEAQMLSNAYARAFIETRRELAVATAVGAMAELRRAIEKLEVQVVPFERGDLASDPLSERLADFRATLSRMEVDVALNRGGATIIKPADLPKGPDEPTPVKTVSLAALVGLLIGVGAAFLIDSLDKKIRSPEHVQRVTDQPVLAVIPIDDPPDGRPIAMSEPWNPSLELYRGLRTNISFHALEQGASLIQVTSSLAGEGKTTVAANLAVVMAQAGHRVALVDANFRHPAIHEMFGVEQSPGITDVLLGGSPRDIVNLIALGQGQHLRVFSSGVPPSHPSELLGGRLMRKLLAEMATHYDFVIVDSAPLLPVADSAALAGAVDRVLLVAQAGRVSDVNLVESLARLDGVSATALGIVINGSERSRSEPRPSDGPPYGQTSPEPAPEYEAVSVDG